MRPWEIAALVLVVTATVAALALVVYVSVQLPRDLEAQSRRHPPPTSFAPVHLASTENLDLEQRPWPLVDGDVLQPGERVLLRNQADSRENGIWEAPTSLRGDWHRAWDLSLPGHVAEGAQVLVKRGATQAEQTFVLRRLSKQLHDPPGRCDIYFVPVLQHLLGAPLPEARYLGVDRHGLATWWRASGGKAADADSPPDASPVPHRLHLLYGFWDGDDGLRDARRVEAEWRRLNPCYSVTLWTPAEAEELVRAKSPEWLTWYTEAARPIMRVDLFKWLLLLHQGGLYLDLDVCPVALPARVTAARFWAVVESHISDHEAEALGSDLEPGPRLGTFALAAVPRHPLIHFVLAALRDARVPEQGTPYDVVAATGSDAFTRVFRGYGHDFADVELAADVPTWCRHERRGSWKTTAGVSK